jgi:hypothetical protein
MCVFVALVIQYAMRMRHNVIFNLSGCTILFHIVLYIIRLEKRVTEHRICVLIFCTTFV